ncbi:MAG TPA: NADPH:quinone oxidoreductase family protein [Acidimicrobiales bacterium]|nr:NADPH:quinone oxidoreductase family protein [Acidimicrobiales bacterium]
MRAALCPAYGPPEVVIVDEVPAPAAGPGQVRVRVGVAAVNFPDVLLVAGKYQITVPPPFVPGSELAGVVVEVGDGVHDLAVGDRVMGTALVGAFAEEAVLGPDAVRRIPDGVDLRVAAAFGVAHRTAYHVLRSVARLQPGEELVVLGAGGGVGLAAVQLGRELGASVTAVASSAAKLEVAASHGAAHLIDHRSVDLRAALREGLPGGADVVVDPVGGDLAEPALRSLRWGGRFVTVGYASGTIPRIPLNLVLLKGVQILGFQFVDFAQRAPEDFRRNEEELTALLASHRAVPHIGAAFALGEVAGALRLVADGGAVGKVVVEIGDVP